MTDAPLRADAQRNRDKLIAAARAAFAAHGLGASLDDIAKSAELGSGTLYRHFPTRDELTAAVFTERMRENIAALESALDAEDPWEGFAGYVRRTCREQAADRGMADLMAIGHPGRELGELRGRAYEGFTALVDRAKASGALRDDLVPEDIVLLLMANAGVIERAGASAEEATERLVSLVLDGFRTEGASPAAAPLEPRKLLVALRRSA
jgi:AcrR family transcriptional regulator